MTSRYHRLRLQVPCSLLVFSMMLGATAQSPTPTDNGSPLTLHVTTRLVVLDVVVLDKSGHPVSNLDRSQFSITEDKVPQKIRSFDPPSGHMMPTGSAIHPIVHGTEDLAKIGNAPVNILVFDELNTKWDGTAYARQQMEKFLKAQPEVLTVPTLLVAAGDDGFKVLHDYTQSRSELLEAIRMHFPQFPWQMMRGGSSINIERLEQTLGTLSQIAESSRGTPGRKNVIWVGSGYPTIDTTSLQFDDENKLLTVIQRVTDRMLASRVTLYMVEPTGVATGSTDSGSGSDDGSAVDTGVANLSPYMGDLDFATFATATGGEIFANRNDVNVAIGQSITDGGVYYTLSYVPTNLSDDAQKYRKIRVKLKDPSLHAVTRDGYFPTTEPVDAVPTGKERPSNQLQFDLMSAAQTRLAYNGLKVQVKLVTVGYQLLVGAKELHWVDQPDGSRLAEITVMTVFFNAKDKELQSHPEEFKEKIGKDVQLNDQAEIAIKLPLEPPPGMARVRFVVRDAATGALGTTESTR